MQTPRIFLGEFYVKTYSYRWWFCVHQANPRKVYFFPDSGQVLIRKIKSLHNNTIMDRESAYRIQLRQKPVRNQEQDVELFDD